MELNKILKITLCGNINVECYFSMLKFGKESEIMTDKEIIKGLELCNREGSIHCKRCPMWRGYETVKCIENLLKNALDLITRQGAEIESLKTENKKMFEKWEKLSNKTKRHYADLYADSVSIERMSAIKEFVSDLKNRVLRKFEYTDIRIFKEIDNLVKEMTVEEQ